MAFGFDVVDANGKSLINPNTMQGENWLNKFMIEYNGEKYYYQGRPVRKMRANIEYYKSFNVVKLELDKNGQKDVRYYLQFGQFQPNYKEEQKMKLHLPDGSVKEIGFVHFAQESKFVSYITVDGKKEEGRIAKIVTTPYLQPGEKETSAPMYIYFAPEKFIEGNEVPQELKGLKIKYNEKEYTLTTPPATVNADTKPALNYQSGILIPLTNKKGLYFSFGPFFAEQNIQQGTFTLTLNELTTEFTFDCYNDKNGEYIYNASPVKSASMGTPLYFKNGPLFFLNSK